MIEVDLKKGVVRFKERSVFEKLETANTIMKKLNVLYYFIIASIPDILRVTFMYYVFTKEINIINILFLTVFLTYTLRYIREGIISKLKKFA